MATPQFRLNIALKKHADGTYEMGFEDPWAGIPLHFYGVSKHFVKIVQKAIQDYFSNGSGELFETFEKLAYTEDFRCRELDDFIAKYKPSFAEIRKSHEFPDDWPRVGIPHVYFEVFDPFEKAKSVREVLQTYKLSYPTFRFFLQYYGGVTKSPQVIKDNRASIQELIKKKLATPARKLPAETLLAEYFRLNTLKEVAKKFGLKLSARKKRDFVNKLLENIQAKKIIKAAAKIESLDGFKFHTIPQLTKENVQWFDNFSLSQSLIVLGTLLNKVEHTFMVLSYNSLRIYSSGYCCSLCKKLGRETIGRFKKLPPYHLGCTCQIFPTL